MAVQKNAVLFTPFSVAASNATDRQVRDLQMALKATERRAKATLLEREVERKKKAK
jgi:hypothetical protein